MFETIDAIGVSDKIAAQWIIELQSPHRHYHTLRHIATMLRAYKAVCSGDNTAIMAAVWLHDIRYDPRRSDNEEVSAEIAREDLRGTSVDIPLVVDIILDTKYHHGGTPVLDLFSDLDLGIFGSEPEQYREYMFDIRREFAFVPLMTYAEKRAEILTGFNANQVFKTDFFKYHEDRAHQNLQTEIELLQGNPTMIEITQ